MQVEISYRMKVTIEGENMNEIRSKWEELNLSDYEQRTEFVEMEGVYDYDTNDDLTEEFCSGY
jgi:post-segregation antitoxin (ccd killing protein)